MLNFSIKSCLTAVSSYIVTSGSLKGEGVSEREREMPATLRSRNWEDYATCIRHLRLKSHGVSRYMALYNNTSIALWTLMNQANQPQYQPQYNSIPLLYINYLQYLMFNTTCILNWTLPLYTVSLMSRHSFVKSNLHNIRTAGIHFNVKALLKSISV